MNKKDQLFPTMLKITIILCHLINSILRACFRLFTVTKLVFTYFLCTSLQLQACHMAAGNMAVGHSQFRLKPLTISARHSADPITHSQGCPMQRE